MFSDNSSIYRLTLLINVQNIVDKCTITICFSAVNLPVLVFPGFFPIGCTHVVFSQAQAVVDPGTYQTGGGRSHIGKL